jgi:hypothetical protein
MTVLRTGTTARIGLWAEYFLGQAPGSTALTDFMGTWTIAMTHTTVIMDRFRSAERSSSTTSMEMKLGMGEAMKGRLPTGRRGNTRYRDIGAAVGIRADIARSGLGCGLPCLKFETWGTRFRADMKGKQRQILRSA